ncbi:hypothetical protein ABZ860_14955 [Microbispora sp. NPDC046973]|uniref:hypothetical protein n=1 Tax=Microbispora sp. NPDC046973 TaxID=3155022 RepID=UPI0033E2CD8D
MRRPAFLRRLGTAGVLLAGLLLAVPVQQATAARSAAATANTEVIASDMQVTPSSYTGPCTETPYGLPHEVSAKITVSRPMTVKYVWINQQEQPWPGPEPVSVTFDAPGTKTVVNGFYRATSLSGYMRLRVVEPAGVAETQNASFNTVCLIAKPTLSDIGKQRMDEGCRPGQPAEFQLTAKLGVADGPSTIGYRWWRRSTQTRNQWVSFADGSATFGSTGAQQQTITARYRTNVSENGYFKVEILSPYQGSSQVAFGVTCSTKNDDL